MYKHILFLRQLIIVGLILLSFLALLGIFFDSFQSIFFTISIFSLLFLSQGFSIYLNKEVKSQKEMFKGMTNNSDSIDSFYTNFYAFDKMVPLSSQEIIDIITVLRKLDLKPNQIEVNNNILKISRYMSTSFCPMLWLKEEFVLKGLHELNNLNLDDCSDKEQLQRNIDFYSLRNSEILDKISSFNIFQRFMATFLGKLPFGIYV